MKNKTTSLQAYQNVITKLEKKIKNPDLEQNSVPKLQEQLVKIADEYQDNEDIGSERYKIYELQGLLFFYQNNDNDALRLLDDAQTIFGANYDYAYELQKQILAESPSIEFTPTVVDRPEGTLGMFSGRIDRLGYVFGIVYSCIVLLVVIISISLLLATSLLSLDSATVCYYISLALLTITFLGIGTRRFHDLNMSGGWAWTLLLPFVPLIILFAPGTEGINDYGPPRVPRNPIDVLFGR